MDYFFSRFFISYNYFVCNVYVVYKKNLFFLSLIFSQWPFSQNCEKKDEKKKKEEKK